MKSIQVTRFGGPEVLQLVQAPEPVPQEGQVLVDVEVADVLFLDAQLRTGWGEEWFGQAPPYIPGTGVAGRVSGDGRRVVAMVQGGYASRAAADVLVEVPDGMALTDAAALAQTGPAAVSLFEAAKIKAGERVLVTAAAGGLGSLLVQLARDAGAEVIGAAGGERKLALIRELGGHAVGYDGVEGSFDVVFDGAGGEAGTAAFQRTADGGRFFAYGVPGGSFASADPAEAERRNITVTGIEQVQLSPAQWAEFTREAFKRVRPVIGQTFPLERAGEAHAAIEAREVVGRTLLIIGAARAARYTDGVLSVDEVEVPEPGPGQVRVRTRAAGVNAVDWKLGKGLMGPRPPQSGTGLEFSGVVETPGPGFEVGQEVFGRGSTGTHVIADVADLVVKPESLTFEQAAALPVVLETALRTLRHVRLERGQTLLVHGAAGGVGQAVAQIALAWGATVVGTASPANHTFLRERGVHPVAYGEGLAARVREAAPQGVDAVIDTAGSGVLGLSVELTGDPAKVVTIADFARAGEHGVHFSTGGLSWPEAWAELSPIVQAPEIAAVFPLQRIQEAHALSETGHARGKIVISIEEPTLPQ